MVTKGKNSLRYFLTTAFVIAVGVGVYVAWHSRPGYEFVPGYMAVQQAFMDHESGIMAEISGKVVRNLRDNRVDVQRQRFMVRMANGQTVMIIHDVTEAERVPIRLDDVVLVRGQYEWEESGGVIHWTHKDSSTERRHGWIDHKGRRYQ